MKFQKRAESSGGSDKFLKFKDGESRNLILRGEVLEHWIKWVNGKGIAVPKDDPSAKSRFKVNALAYENGAFKAYIWEISVQVYNQLASIAEEYPMDQTKIKVSRQGIGMDTVYMILPLVSEKDKLTPAILTQIAAIPLNILDTKSPPKSPEVDHDFGEPPPEMDSELPF